MRDTDMNMYNYVQQSKHERTPTPPRWAKIASWADSFHSSAAMAAAAAAAQITQRSSGTILDW